MKKFVAALSLASAIVLPASAQAKGVSIEANGARAHDVWGGELGLAYNLRFAGFTLRPIGGAFIYQGDNDRYQVDQFSNWQSRCRDTTNGQFAADEKCDNTAVKAYGKLELTYTIAGTAEIGGGARFSSEKVRPYGTLSFPVLPKLRVKANAGDSYYAVGLRADF
jgi:hypothetical protein